MEASTTGGIGSWEEQMPNLDHNEDGLLKRMANDHDHLQHITNSTPSFGQRYPKVVDQSLWDCWVQDLKTKEEKYLDGKVSGIVDELKIRGIGQMNLDIPNQTDSVSPIDISDDERPPP
ncbi:hypothetical protein PPACK8108_LOCUS1976 [Phakopsora pachyrhizi]|uniref:Uncharacterized protein n=1 Tax=Phakopsora pachyrhizi TaxID=170000 RepID=A0AAV0AHC2_PHAPC|nr:hypothetical protein PPACK8108_LOCUS1976 [Phakopsora pachyrhizi]